jgi:hypothetical protein
MLSLAEDTIAGLRAFLNQRDDLILVLDAADGDLPAGLKIIEGLDAELSWVWGWVFVESFADPVSYVDAITQGIVTKQTAMSGVLQREGKPPLPPLACFAARYDTRASRPAAHRREVCTLDGAPSAGRCHAVRPGAAGDR